MATTALRADAARNREQLVASAREVFGLRGLSAPLDEIAKHAELGNATLYRHFPTRADLIAAVFVDTLQEAVTTLDLALAEPDPWTGFVGQVRALCRLQAGNRALADLLTARVTGAPEIEELRSRAFAGTVRLIDNAKRSGQLRREFRHEDLILLLMANAGLIERTAETAPTAWERHLDYVLDGLRPSATHITKSPGGKAVLAAMTGVAHRFGCDGPEASH
jgi:AcrR family transcriptional regulator